MRLLFCSLFTLSCFGARVSATSQPRALAFEARNGDYVSHGPGYALSVTSGGAVLSLSGHAVHMSVPGASPQSSLEPLDRMPGKANYFLGRDVRASYDLFGRIRWRGVYSGIDVVFRGNQEHLEYDFEIGAGRDPGRIKLGFEGVDDIRIDPNGDLVLRLGALQINQPKPVAYQMIAAGQKQPVDVAYRIDASNHVRFWTGAYDRERSLVIDPEIVFDTSFGGTGVSTAAGLARDSQGGLYVTGATNSTDFPTVNAVQSQLGTAPLLVTANAGQTWSFPSLAPADSVSAIVAAPSAPMVDYIATPVGVFKSANGGTTWTETASTGLVGPATALAVDASSATTVYAATAQSIFVSTDGAATWQASTNGINIPTGVLGAGVPAIAAHPTQAGTVFVSVQNYLDGLNPFGLFRSNDFGKTWTELPIVPQLSSPINAIVVAPNGTIIAASSQGLLISADGGNTWTAGASQGAQNNQALAIAPDSPFTLYLINPQFGLQKSVDGGLTLSQVLPSVALPSVRLSNLARVVVDPRNPATVYVSDSDVLYRSTNAGQTWSQLSLPYMLTAPSLFVSPVNSSVLLGAGTQSNVFVTKWSADGSQILYSTYLGGSGGDSAAGIAVDGTGSAYVVGFTSSADFPTTAGAFQTKLNNPPDVFVAKLSPDGSQLVYSTLIGSGSQYAAIAVNGTGDAVITGGTQGNFPVTANAFENAPGAGCATSEFNAGDAFVTRIAADGKSLIYSTYLGGSCPATNNLLVSPSTYGVGVALDASGNAWVTGGTLSPDFPVTSDALQPKFAGGLDDGFLARFSPAGGLDYATYIGGPGYDALSAIAFDSSGNIYLTGESGGLSQPASAGAYQPAANASCPIIFIGPSFPVPQGNALVLKLDPKAHSVLGLTYLGAPFCLAGSTIAVDSAGEPWISGGLQNISAPQTANPFEIGIGQGFISKFSADFTQLLFSTYFDQVAGLALDSSGFAYVAGTGTPNATTGTQQVYIAKIDATTSTAISLDSVMSVLPPLSFSLSYSPAIAAGEVIEIAGTNMGPAASTPGVIKSGVLATNVAGVEVTFDGAAAPLLSVSAQEIELVAPFELATKSTTTIQVQYNGVQSNPVQVGVTATALQILEVLNDDFSVNSASNPARAGSVMSLYLAGAGQTNPPSPDGKVNAAPLAALAMPIQLSLPVTFAGAASGLAAGIFQVNFVAPQQSALSVSLTVGTIASVFFNVFVK